MPAGEVRSPMHKNLRVLSHPLIQAKVTVLRRKETPSALFKQTVDELTGLMLYEITGDLPTRTVEIETPLERTRGEVLDVSHINIVTILRAGLGMVGGVVRLLPDVRVGVLGFERDERTLQARFYYAKLPEFDERTRTIVLDPMLATGGTAVAALEHLRERGVGEIAFASIIAAPEGVRRVHALFPDVVIYTAALDRELNERGFILPGLGDAGDRIFGTEGVGPGLAPERVAPRRTADR
ncbi:MAG: uracil phosphoribosyltransferase [Planctomycetota bacterium]|nr:MAG: uracil phosphoribosyltransferase [Planctomycetota bacterium]